MIPHIALNAVCIQPIGTTLIDSIRWADSLQSDFISSVTKSSVNDILAVEAISQQALLAAWESWFGFDISSLYRANIRSKRVIYTTKPAFQKCTWQLQLPIRGINTRTIIIADVGNSPLSTRLEAVSPLPLYGFQSYVAFQVQYIADLFGRKWQVLQPVLLFANNVCTLLIHLHTDNHAYIIRYIRLLMSWACHDYIHATMMRWFDAPRLNASTSYLQMLIENGPPLEMKDWHDTLNKCGFVKLKSSGVSRPIRDILEYQAGFIHRRNLEYLTASNPETLLLIRDVAIQVDQSLSLYTTSTLKDKDAVPHLAAVVCWLLLAMFRTDKLVLLSKQWGLTCITPPLICSVAEQLFWGFYSTLDDLDDCSFFWENEFCDIRVPFVHYAECLNRFIASNQ